MKNFRPLLRLWSVLSVLLGAANGLFAGWSSDVSRAEMEAAITHIGTSLRTRYLRRKPSEEGVLIISKWKEGTGVKRTREAAGVTESRSSHKRKWHEAINPGATAAATGEPLVCPPCFMLNSCLSFVVGDSAWKQASITMRNSSVYSVRFSLRRRLATRHKEVSTHCWGTN